jgi:hypothetical protein
VQLPSTWERQAIFLTLVSFHLTSRQSRVQRLATVLASSTRSKGESAGGGDFQPTLSETSANLQIVYFDELFQTDDAQLKYQKKRRSQYILHAPPKDVNVLHGQLASIGKGLEN